MSIQEIMTSNQKFYSRYFDEIKADSLNYVDNDSTGAFKTIEYYHIPNFWTIGTDSVKRFSFYAFVINSIIQRPKETQRKMPIALIYPAKYIEEIIFDLPSEWNVTESKTHLTNSGFIYNSSFYAQGNFVHLRTTYENEKDCVTTDEAPAYFKNLNEFDKIESFEISYGGVSINNGHTDSSNKNISSVIIAIVLISGGMIWWKRRRF